MSGRRVPRAIVIAIATAIVCVPAITAVAYQYIRDGQSRVVHLHRGVYEIYNGINATTGMTASADYAINNWGNQLADRDTVAVREVPGLTGTEVWFRDYDLPDAGAAVLWSETWHQTSLPIDVVFDSTKESSWSQNLKQHKACNVIGNLLGLADSPGSGDCMDGTTDSPTASATSADAVDDFYGPNVSFANQLFDNRTNLDSALTYPLDVTASGHAIQSVTVTLDGNQIATKTITPCDGSCSVGVSPNVGPLSAGAHIVAATATNQFGQTHLGQINLTVIDPPETEIDTGPSRPTSDATPTFTYHSTRSGSTFKCRIDGAIFMACPASGYTVSSALADGTHTFAVKATDSAGHVDPTPATRTFTVDTAAPTLNGTGTLISGTNPLVGAAPEVEVNAADTGSGVSSVEMQVDGEGVDKLSQACPSGGCGLEDGLFPDLSNLAPGQHSYSIVARDFAGNPSAQISGSFRLDPQAPVLAVSGQLADLDELPLNSDTADAAIHAEDQGVGESGITKIEVLIDDDVAATHAVSCDPTCPGTADYTYTYSRNQWGAGPHDATITATDRAGNVSQRNIDIDIPVPSSDVACPGSNPAVQAPIHTVTPQQAQDGAIAPAVAPSIPTPDPESDEQIDPSLSDPVDSLSAPLESERTLSQDQLEPVATTGVTINDVVCLIPQQTTIAESDAIRANGDVAVYANTASDTDTIIRPSATGETLIQSIRGEDAPQSYSWEVGIPAGDELRQLDEGGIAVVDPSEEPSDAPVPDAPPTAGPGSIPDAYMQLVTSNYEIAEAEQETGQRVDAVIARPYAVNTAGAATPTSVTLGPGQTITAHSIASSRALVEPVYAAGNAGLCRGVAERVDLYEHFKYRLGARCKKKVVQIKVHGWISPKPPGNTFGTKDYFHRNCPLYPKKCLYKTDSYSYFIQQGCVKWDFHYTWYTTHGSHTRRERGHKGGNC